MRDDAECDRWAVRSVGRAAAPLPAVRRRRSCRRVTVVVVPDRSPGGWRSSPAAWRRLDDLDYPDHGGPSWWTTGPRGAGGRPAAGSSLGGPGPLSGSRVAARRERAAARNAGIRAASGAGRSPSPTTTSRSWTPAGCRGFGAQVRRRARTWASVTGLILPVRARDRRHRCTSSGTTGGSQGVRSFARLTARAGRRLPGARRASPCGTTPGRRRRGRPPVYGVGRPRAPARTWPFRRSRRCVTARRVRRARSAPGTPDLGRRGPGAARLAAVVRCRARRRARGLGVRHKHRADADGLRLPDARATAWATRP